MRVNHYGIESEQTYIKSSKDEAWRILQIESVEAVNNIDEIIKIGGFQSLFIGPADLGLSIAGMQKPDKSLSIDNIIKDIGVKCKNAGIYLGSYSKPEKNAVKALMEIGCQWMFIEQDFKIFSNQLVRMINNIKE